MTKTKFDVMYVEKCEFYITKKYPVKNIEKCHDSTVRIKIELEIIKNVESAMKWGKNSQKRRGPLS